MFSNAPEADPDDDFIFLSRDSAILLIASVIWLDMLKVFLLSLRLTKKSFSWLSLKL